MAATLLIYLLSTSSSISLCTTTLIHTTPISSWDSRSSLLTGLEESSLASYTVLHTAAMVIIRGTNLFISLPHPQHTLKQLHQIQRSNSVRPIEPCRVPPSMPPASASPPHLCPAVLAFFLSSSKSNASSCHGAFAHDSPSPWTTPRSTVFLVNSTHLSDLSLVSMS